MILRSHLEKADLFHKRVFLRADLNIPAKNGVITSDFRLQALKPTLDLLCKKKARIILGTHRGRPQAILNSEGEKHTSLKLRRSEGDNGSLSESFREGAGGNGPLNAASSIKISNNDSANNFLSPFLPLGSSLRTLDAELSTSVLIKWFVDHGYIITWIPTLEKAYEASFQISPGSLILLENLRFFKGEQSDDLTERKHFAQQLCTLGDYYVNDAFALLHRHDTSITLLPELYQTEQKTIGLLIEREIEMLSKLFSHPERPFMALLGGGKVKDKLPYIEKLLDKIDTLALLPGFVFTFLAAQGKETGDSLIDPVHIAYAAELLKKARERGVTVLFPNDYLVEDSDNTLRITTTLAPGQRGLAVGPQTVKNYKKALLLTKTIYINGAMGFEDIPASMEPFTHLLEAIASSRLCSIIGGGDSVAVVYNAHLEKMITYCSTGGGASLYFLAYGTLPALKYVA